MTMRTDTTAQQQGNRRVRRGRGRRRWAVAVIASAITSVVALGLTCVPASAIFIPLPTRALRIGPYPLLLDEPGAPTFAVTPWDPTLYVNEAFNGQNYDPSNPVQRFNFLPMGGNTYEIELIASGLCLEPYVPYASQPFTGIVQSGCGTSTSSLLNWQMSIAGPTTIVNDYSGECMIAEDLATVPNTPWQLVQRPCGSGGDTIGQVWSLR